MNINEILTVTIVLAALFSYINHRFIKWPPTIGIMVITLVLSILLATLGNAHSMLSEKAVQLVTSIDFQDVLMNFMLSFCCLPEHFILMRVSCAMNDGQSSSWQQ